jgi:hypothetical protein
MSSPQDKHGSSSLSQLPMYADKNGFGNPEKGVGPLCPRSRPMPFEYALLVGKGVPNKIHGHIPQF